MCVQGMDHHCVWMANCIGAGNLRDFVLFLSWMLVGSLYAATVAACVLLYCWSEVPVSKPHNAGLGRHIAALMQPFVHLAVPPNLVMAFSVLVLSAGASIGMALMLMAQLRLIWRGTSYLESLKLRPSAAPAASGWQNLCQVLGPSVWLWPVPCLQRSKHKPA